MNFVDRFKAGEIILVADDADRENEVDMIIAAQHLTLEKMQEMLKHGTGIICICMLENRAQKLQLPLMVNNNNDKHRTAFTVSCDATDCLTGVSAEDRCKTVQAVMSNNHKRLNRPGHMFPLIAQNGLLNVRRGHTEAAVQLCLLADLPLVGVIVECIKPDGTMLRTKDVLSTFGSKYPLVTIQHLVYQSNYQAVPTYISPPIFETTTTPLISKFGFGQVESELVVFKNFVKNIEMAALCYPTYEDVLSNKNNALIRIHSECLTSHVFKSQFCECSEQLEASLKTIIDSKKCGMVLYVNKHEGRGIGLFDKVQAYFLQQNSGVDTYKANILLGHKEDERNYDDVISILKFLDIKKLHLLTNNSVKLQAFVGQFEQVIQHPVEGVKTHEHNQMYVKAKEEHEKNKK
jgi:3,4-dihydroxy 2-butanone 4-phosphate synthase/GTP cyclohydrolase II